MPPIFFVDLLLNIWLGLRVFRQTKKASINTPFFDSYIVTIRKSKTLFVITLLLPLAQLWLGFLVSSPATRFPLYWWVLAPFWLNIPLATVTIMMFYRRNVSVGWLLLLIFGFLLAVTGNFSGIYFDIGTSQNWNVPLSHLDALFVTVGTLTTAGTGNIVAVSEEARGFMLIQMAIDFTVVAVVVSLLLTRMSGQRAGKTSEYTGDN